MGSMSCKGKGRFWLTNFTPEFAARSIFRTRLHCASARQATAHTIPAVGSPAELIKYPLTFDPCGPLFTWGKCPKFWPKFRPQSSSDRRIYCSTLSENRNKLVKDRWQVYHHTKVGLARSPNSENHWRNGNGQVQHRQCYTTCWAVAAVKRLPCHISQFTPYISQGQTAVPPSVNFEPPSYLRNY